LDQVADAYDRFRPGYPAPILPDVEFLASLPPRGRILEIGSGTGQLTATFAQRGYSIVALEPGTALATIARANLASYPNVQVVGSTMEDWGPDSAPFDLVLAAQSFHLVDLQRRFALAAGVLSPRGALAIVWSYRLPGDSPAHRALQAAYAHHAPPTLPPDQLWQDTPFEDEIDRSGLFESVFMRKYLWTQVYDPTEYVGLLESHASHHALPLPVRSALYDAIGEGIARNGGRIAIDYVTRLFVATLKRNPSPEAP
jgi:SAM-dependent methyltransferase